MYMFDWWGSASVKNSFHQFYVCEYVCVCVYNFLFLILYICLFNLLISFSFCLSHSIYPYIIKKNIVWHLKLSILIFKLFSWINKSHMEFESKENKIKKKWNRMTKISSLIKVLHFQLYLHCISIKFAFAQIVGTCVRILIDPMSCSFFLKKKMSVK